MILFCDLKINVCKQIYKQAYKPSAHAQVGVMIDTNP